MEDETSQNLSMGTFVHFFLGGCNKDAVFFSGHILPVGREPPHFLPKDLAGSQATLRLRFPSTCQVNNKNQPRKSSGSQT